jgi:hypothetical protein
MLWIRIGFNTDPDPDPVLYLNVDTDTDPGSQTNADPDGSRRIRTFESKKLNFYLKNILKVGKRSKNITTKVQKSQYGSGSKTDK